MLTQAQRTKPQPESMNPHRSLFWREWALITAAGTVASLAVLPAMWSLVERTAQQWGVSLPVFLASQLLESGVQIALLAAVGLFFARRVGLGAPIIEGYLAGENEGKPIRPIILPAVGLGILGAVAMIAVDRMVFARLLPGFSTPITQIGGWQGLLVSFDGGIVEEIQMRLFLLSVLAWLFSKVSHTERGLPTQGALWLATLIAALVFAFGHLSATSITVVMIPLVVLRSLVLNGILGILFGTFYWKRGLEAAVLCHFAADLVVHFIWPFVR